MWETRNGDEMDLKFALEMHRCHSFGFEVVIEKGVKALTKSNIFLASTFMKTTSLKYARHFGLMQTLACSCHELSDGVCRMQNIGMEV